MRVVNADVRELDESGFDRALVDAPCSGLGVLARRPDLRWRARPLPELQLELLRAAAERTRPGGTVVYSVCTLNADENEAVVDASGLEVEPLGDGVAAVRAPEAAGVPAHAARTATARRLLHRAAEAVRSRRCPGATGSATVEVEPSLYGADFANLGDQIEALLRAGCRVFHFDVGDGHFVEPITMGPIVLQSISPLVHGCGGAIDVHLMVENPAKYFEPVAAAGGDSVTFHYEAVDDVAATIRAAREHGLQAGVAFNPETEPERRRRGRCGRRPRALHGDPSRATPGQPFQEATFERVERLRAALPDACTSRSTAASAPTNIAQLYDARRDAARRGLGDLRARGPAARLPPARASARVTHRARALELARRGARAARIRSRPSARSSSRDGEVVGEGVTEAGGRHAEVVALDAAGERARGATLYVTLEPCAHHGTTPPCTDAIVAAGVARVVFGARDPNPEAAGGAERLRAAGVEVELADSFEARAQNEAWRTWVARGRPFVIYKVGDDARRPGRRCPGERWVTGEESRRLVHELRAAVDAVAVGGGTARADRPRLDARDVATPRGQPRRLVFSRGPLPGRARPRAADAARSRTSCARSRREGVQSLLLEGGPTLAAAFLEAGSSTSCCVFVAPVLAGDGPAAGRCATLRAHAVAPDGHGRSARTCSSKPMSTSPDTAARRRPARHASAALADAPARQRRAARARSRRSAPTSSHPGGATAVDELLAELADGGRPASAAQLEMVVRETVETLAYGD